MDDVPPVKVGQGLEQLQDVSSGRGRVGRLISESFGQRIAIESFLDQTKRPQVVAFVHIPDDPRMARRTQGAQDIGLDPKPFLGLFEIGPARLLDDDRLSTAGLARIDGRHPSLSQLADDLIATSPTFQGTRKGEGHTVRGPISPRTGASPTQRCQSHRRLEVQYDPCRSRGFDRCLG